MTRVKICGITTPTDRDHAIGAGADALGFTVGVTVDTPREISPDTAANLIDETPPFVTSVLVTMPDDPAHARRLLAETGADAIQLHGSLAPAAISEIASAAGSVIAAVDVNDPDRAHELDAIADALIVDSTRAGGAGGTGKTHDWTRTRSLRDAVSSPVILAGGLTPTNVTEAIATVKPYAVDVASGVEHTGGQKDPAAVDDFIKNATKAPEAISQ